MTWTKLGDTFCERNTVNSLTDSAFRLHIEALVFLNRNLLNGHLPTAALARLGGRAKARSVIELVTAGLWTEDAAGWAVDWHEQEVSAKVRDRQEADAERQRRQRKHNAGDHTQCDPRRCWVLKGEAKRAAKEARKAAKDLSVTPVVTRDVTRDLSRPSAPPVPVPTPNSEPEPEGLEGEERGKSARSDAGASSGAPPEDDEHAPVDPFLPVGDCPHMPGGRDTNRVIPGRIRCKPCRLLADEEVRRRDLEEVRAELDAQRAGKSA